MDGSIFLGYFSTKSEYICYNLNSHKIIERTNVKVDDTKSKIQIQERMLKKMTRKKYMINKKKNVHKKRMLLKKEKKE